MNTPKALTFEQFTASRVDMNEADANRALSLAPGDLGEDIQHPIAVFADGACCAHVTGENSLMVPIYNDELHGDDDTGAWALYWDFYLPECCTAENLTLDVLTSAYAEFCKREGLPHISADEQLAELRPCQVMLPQNFKDRSRIESLDWFTRIWTEVEDREREQLRADLDRMTDEQVLAPDTGSEHVIAYYRRMNLTARADHMIAEARSGRYGTGIAASFDNAAAVLLAERGDGEIRWVAVAQQYAFYPKEG